MHVVISYKKQSKRDYTVIMQNTGSRWMIHDTGGSGGVGGMTNTASHNNEILLVWTKFGSGYINDQVLR